ncbi:paralemmin 1a isoform X3 [Notolabrus celidotus]|uniref:paralemmin 1a isoform X3 n=1 Tax=Notolabrus celidotus TaxID=1203425 RepID=UPI001490362A|nr:paralemmin 1a isoform X3 [Notolabrus celidotus]
MEVGEALGQQDRLQLLAEKRKRQTEIENKKRQLEDDKRALQHLKSKALRERWLLDGAPPAGQEQDEAKSRLEQNEAETRTLEDTINRLERELVDLETGALCETIIQTAVSPGSVTAVEVEGHSICLPDPPAVSGQVVQEVKVHKSSRVNKPREMTEEMKKVVHEMNGEDGVQLLSVTEVEELIHKADEASMMSQTVATVPSLPTEEVQEEEEEPQPILPVPAEITGLETKPSGEPSVEEASAEKPVTMVFMGYQNVEDEDETKKVLGLQGTVKAELVLIDDYNGKTPPSEGKEETAIPPIAAPPTSASTPLIPSTKTPDTTSAASNGETAGEAGEVKGGAVQIKKEKQPCKCCSIM